LFSETKVLIVAVITQRIPRHSHKLKANCSDLDEHETTARSAPAEARAAAAKKYVDELSSMFAPAG